MAKVSAQYINMDSKEKQEELNSIEKQKLNKRPFEYYNELDKLDFDSIGKGDRYYLQDFGIYNNELSDDEFMLRLRLIAGRISNENLLGIANIALKYDLSILLTARAGMQIHGLEEDNILEVFRQIDNLGLTSWQTFGDNIRNITTDVFDGVGQYNIIEVYPYIEQMQKFILKVPQYVGMLPRRISVGISGSYKNSGSYFSSDLYFALAKKDDIYGFNIYMGGKNTELAQDANIFLQKEQVVDFFKAFVIAFNKHGLRKHRNRTRLFHLIEDIGMEQFKVYIKDEFINDFEEKGEVYLEKIVLDEYEKLKNDKYSFCYRSYFSKISAQELLNIATEAIKKDYEIRIGTDQQLYIFNLENRNINIQTQNKNRTVIACAGSEYCPYSFWNIKDETSYLPLIRIQKHKILIGFSGCLKGCAKHQHSDIGLVGLRSSMYGYSQKTARVYLGAEYSLGKKVAKQIFAVVPLTNLKEVLDIVINEFENSKYSDFEDFSKNILNKFTADFLALWFLAKLQSKKNILLKLGDEIQLLKNNFSDMKFIKYLDEGIDVCVKYQVKELWHIDNNQ